MADSSQQHYWQDSLRLLLKWLEDPTILGLLGLFIGLLGIVLGFVLYLKSRRIKKHRYAIQSTNLVKNYVSRLDGVEITYHQKKISNLTVTKIAIWNDGNETIDRNDVASSDPVTIRIKKDYQILDASIIHSTDKTNGFKLLAKENGLIQISFDYIDHFQGIIVQILHDGRSSHDLTIEGTIKGAGKIVENRFLVPYLRSPSSGVKKHNVIWH